jgi:hypothetical protein
MVAVKLIHNPKIPKHHAVIILVNLSSMIQKKDGHVVIK